MLQTSQIRVSKLGFRFYALFYCYIPYVSLTFYSKLLSLIISHKNFKKHLVLVGFFFFFLHVRQTSRYKVLILRNRLLFYTLLFFEILFKVMKPNHSPQKFLKMSPITRFFSTCFKRPRLGFPNSVFDFMPSFTVLYPMFLRHSILNY